MLDRSDTFRAAAIAALIAVGVASVVAINRRPASPIAEAATTIAAPAPDDLSAELRRCGALDPKDAGEARCAAVWEENRRRFFGRTARPLPQSASPDLATSAVNSSEGAP